LIIELKSKNPFINLRLLLRRNFGFGSLTNFVLGLSMYGALFLLPTYLATVQHYNSVYIGRTMMWAGLPQLFIIPFLPALMARFDSRWMAFLGINIFGLSCLMNSHLSIFVGIDQLKWSQILRAMGQPLLMVPLSTITTGLIEKEQIGSAAGLYNMLRNLGGSVGIAILSTILTIREQFHSARLLDRINVFNTNTAERLQGLTSHFISSGFDSVTASSKALAAVDYTVREQAQIMAFNDCFLFCCNSFILQFSVDTFM